MATATNGTHDDVDVPRVNGNGTSNTNGRHGHGRSLSRRVSSPMMPAFMVSAPGKVIVFGEHAVVHGKVSKTRPKTCAIARSRHIHHNRKSSDRISVY